MPPIASSVENTSQAGATLLTSRMCRQAELESPTFQEWGARLAQPPMYMHRKVWEFAFICQALEERGMLQPGRRGLGFAVGTEPLAALFASRGCEILATDLVTDQAKKAGWVDTNQHASSLDALHKPALCSEERFKELVSFRFVDMRELPDDLGSYDFIWSACSFEHLGTLEQGLQFVLNSAPMLKPGGVAVHTTEYNVSSNDKTIDDGGVVIYRRKDIEDVADRLRNAGYSLELDFTDGNLPADLYVDKHPYKQEVHLKLDLWGYAATSYGLIIHAPSK
jgi:hypothetical protein